MRVLLLVIVMSILGNVAKASTPTVQDLINSSTSEEQCLSIAITDDQIDQCMDMAY
jgi:hypothetical protein